MILTKSLQILVVGRTVKYYNDLGYRCKVSDIIEIDVEHLPKQSKNKIKCKCDYCNKEKEITFYAYNKNYDKYQKYACCVKCAQDKTEKTNNILYNSNRPLQNNTILQKLKKTNKDKYGFETACKNIIIKNKVTDSVNEYIKNNRSKHDEYVQKSVLNRKNKTINKYGNLNIISLENSTYKIKCEKGHIYNINSNVLYHRIKYSTEICTICNPLNNKVSGYELQLRNYIEEIYNGSKVYNSRNIIYPYELDIYLPKLNLAFEFNGMYWHSLRDKNYHHNKSKKCKNKGIRLFYIWENQWKTNKKYIKKWIYNIINNISNIEFLDDNMINEYSTISDIHLHKGYKIKRFFGDILNQKIINIIDPIEIEHNVYNEGYEIYEIQ